MSRERPAEKYRYRTLRGGATRGFKGPEGGLEKPSKLALAIRQAIFDKFLGPTPSPRTRRNISRDLARRVNA